MAAESNHNRKRVDSVIDAEPISQTLATAQKYCSAMSLLASENGFRALSEVLELLPRRENEIRTRDETIKDLNTKLAAQEKSHKAFNQKQMENFEERYSDWDEEKTTLQGEVEELEEAAKDQDMEVEALRRELEKTNSRVKDFEEERTKNIKGLKKLEQQVAELEGKLQNTQANADKHKNELEGSYDQVAALKKSLEEETNKVSNLVTRTTKMKERLETFRQFSVEIVDLNLQAT
jgi:chromosome segregation ATPase